MDAEDVVVHGEHVKVRRGACGRLGLDSDLSVIYTRKIAGTGRLMFFGLKGERIRVHTGHGGTAVVLEGLHGIEVLTRLLLEPVLTVENKLEGVDGTVGLLGPGVTTVGHLKHGSTRRARGNDETVTSRAEDASRVGGHDLGGGREVPEVGAADPAAVGAENQLLDRVVVLEADLLRGTGGGHSVGASVLDLFDKVLMTLLRESPTILSVEVNVISPDLEGAVIGIQ